MPAVSQYSIKNLLLQLNKCEKMENRGNERILAVVGLVVALLALLLAIMSYRPSRFNHPASSLSPSPFVMACPLLPSSLLLIILILYSQSRNQLQQVPGAPLPGRSATIPPPDFSRVSHVSIYNTYSNAPFAGANLSTFSYQNNGISRGDMKVA